MAERKHRVFAVEGLDGSGKTVISKSVAEQTGNIYLYPSGIDPFRSLRPFFDSQPKQVRFMYYLGLNLSSYPLIEKLRQQGEVFVDRTVFSTIAYHKAYGLSEKWIGLVPQVLLDQYDAMIYMFVNEFARIKRMTRRNEKLGLSSVNDEKSTIFGPRIIDEYQKLFDARTIKVNTRRKNRQVIITNLIKTLGLSTEKNSPVQVD